MTQDQIPIGRFIQENYRLRDSRVGIFPPIEEKPPHDESVFLCHNEAEGGIADGLYIYITRHRGPIFQAETKSDKNMDR